MKVQYFKKVALKSWSLIDALKAYDVVYDLTIAELCVIMKQDLITLKSKRNEISTFERTVELLFQEISDLESLKCLKKSESDVKENQANQSSSKENIASTVHHVGNASDCAVNVGHINIEKSIIHTTTETANKRRKVSEDRDENGDSNVYTKSPSMRPTEPQDNNDQLPPFDELTRSSHLPNQLTLIHGKNQYVINTPSRNINSPHKPKLTNSHVDSLKEYVKFATSNLITVDSTTNIYYQQQKKNQRQNYSLKRYGLLDDIYEVLNHMEFLDFPLNLWKRSFNNNVEGADILSNTMKYVLCNFHMQCQDDYTITNNHERSFFVENVVPGLLSLAKTSKLVSFSWCEFELQSIKSIGMFDHDLNLVKTPRRYMDALGKMRSTSDTEVVIVESSSGGQLEDVSHSIGDTIKTIECATASLIFTASKYKQTSVQTFKSMKVFSIHIIKNVMTLIETSMDDKYTWKRIELRACTIPTNWSTKLHMIKYFELLATLYDGIKECEVVEQRLADEHIVPRYNGVSLEEYLGKQNKVDLDSRIACHLVY